MNSFDSMKSFELNILDEKSRIGSEFMAHVVDEIQRAWFTEKSTRKLTQQAIAEKIGTTRAVINRQIQGHENLSARRIAELLWAIGWEPSFEAKKLPHGRNDFVTKTNDDRPALKKTDGTTIIEMEMAPT
jgi:hypothetical protein